MAQKNAKTPSSFLMPEYFLVAGMLDEGRKFVANNDVPRLSLKGLSDQEIQAWIRQYLEDGGQRRVAVYAPGPNGAPGDYGRPLVWDDITPFSYGGRMRSFKPYLMSSLSSEQREREAQEISRRNSEAYALGQRQHTPTPARVERSPSIRPPAYTRA